MITQIRKFLTNDLDLSTVDADVSYRDFSELSIFNCNLSTTLDEYINALRNCNSVLVIIFSDHYWYGDLSRSSDNDDSLSTICNHRNVDWSSSLMPYSVSLSNKSLGDIVDASTRFSDIEVLLLTENIYTSIELNDYEPNNLTVIESNVELYNHLTVIESNVDVGRKQFTTQQHVICLNNKPRPHRVGVVLYLTILNLKNNIHISFMAKERWKQNTKYDYNSILSYMNPYSHLYNKMMNISLHDEYEPLSEYVYESDSVDGNISNMQNFKKLIPLYKETVIEIITESTSLEMTANLAEKFVHCVIGKCFPIIIGTYRNVEIYRQMGYDMFDDIIDHSYDYESNPFYRLKMAIDLNIDILTNKDMAVELYYKNEYRLDNNIENYKTQYDVILSNTIGDLDAELSKMGV